MDSPDRFRLPHRSSEGESGERRGAADGAMAIELIRKEPPRSSERNSPSAELTSSREAMPMSAAPSTTGETASSRDRKVSASSRQPELWGLQLTFTSGSCQTAKCSRRLAQLT